MRFAHTKGPDIKSLHGAFSLPLHHQHTLLLQKKKKSLAAMHKLSFTVVWHLKAAVRFLQEIIDLFFFLQ